MKQALFKSILLVEDNPIDIFIHTKVIQQSGFADLVVSIPSAKKAIEYLSSDNPIPDIILLDIRMPEMDGFEFLEELTALKLESLSNVRIILLSSSIATSDYQRAQENPLVMDFIPKPLTREKLLALEN